MSLHFKYKKFSKLWGKSLLLVAVLASTASSFPADINAGSTKSAHFLSVADIHFDPFLSCPLVGNCPLVDKLDQAPANAWQAIFEKEDHSLPHYSKDSNYSLVKSSMAAIKTEAQAKKVEFAIVIGDAITHEFEFKYRRYTRKFNKNNYQAFIKKTMEFLAIQLRAALPTQNIYFAVGNNDSYQGDYATNANGAFFKESGALWAKQLNAKKDQSDLQQQYLKAGYYALNAPEQANLRLIFLNSVIFSKKARGKNLNVLAQEQLEWLQHELSQAAEKKTKSIYYYAYPYWH